MGRDEMPSDLDPTSQPAEAAKTRGRAERIHVTVFYVAAVIVGVVWLYGVMPTPVYGAVLVVMGVIVAFATLVPAFVVAAALASRGHSRVLSENIIVSSVCGVLFGITASFLAFGTTRRWNPGLAVDLFAIFLVLPVVAGEVIYRFTWSYPPGLCARCGYDLRASADRCPECGAKKES